MSILIKSMEMPDDCKTCDLCQYDDRLWGFCPMDDESIADEGRREDCPLIEVPTPHGRLIDADVLIKQIKKEAINQAKAYANRHHPVVRAYGDCYEKVVDLPTIIEAEGE